MLSTWLLVALVGAPAQAAPSADPSWSRIVNGRNAKATDFPAAVDIELSFQGYDVAGCTASLITPRLLLTAGHCTEELIKEAKAQHFDLSKQMVIDNFAAYFGQKLDGADTIAVPFADYHPHPDYGMASNGAPTNDVNIVELSEDVDFVQPVWFRTEPLTQSEAVGQAVTSVGYGLTSGSPSDQDTAGRKRIAELEVSALQGQFLISFAADNPDHANVCSGDSGGPQYARVGQRWVQWGVHSFVFATTNTNTPNGPDPCLQASGSTDVSQFADFVLGHVERVHGSTDFCAINHYYLDRTCDTACADHDADCDVDVDGNGLVDDVELADVDDDGDGALTEDEVDQWLNPKKGCDTTGGAPMVLAALGLLALRRRR